MGTSRRSRARSPRVGARFSRCSPNSAALAKRLNDTSGKLDVALADFDTLVKAVDTKKIANVVDGADALGEVLEAKQGQH